MISDDLYGYRGAPAAPIVAVLAGHEVSVHRRPGATGVRPGRMYVYDCVIPKMQIRQADVGSVR